MVATTASAVGTDAVSCPFARVTSKTAVEKAGTVSLITVHKSSLPPFLGFLARSDLAAANKTISAAFFSDQLRLQRRQLPAAPNVQLSVGEIQHGIHLFYIMLGENVVFLGHSRIWK
ncbi:MAG TPA: hypothetical protein VK812_16645 [Candidatus Binatus sp.]|nr:hypothetical protein [Candidatus Binatus sp.]